MPYASCGLAVSGANTVNGREEGRGKGKREPRACNGFGHVRIRGVMMPKIAILAAAFLALLSVYPSARLSSQALHVPYQTFTLPNGLQVLLHEDHSVPLVSVNMWYHVGSSDENILQRLYPPDHPYHWPVIGSMADLSAATLDDVRGFFRTYYTPNNATLAIAGDITPRATRQLVERYFGDIPRGPAVTRPTPPAVQLGADVYATIEDRVQVPRVYDAWHTVKAFADGDATLDVLANVLAGGRSSRLYQRLVYELQIATDVVAFQDGGRIDGKFELWATARPGHDLTELERVIDEEIGKIAQAGPTPREVERAQNSFEAQFLSRMERVGGFGGKADQLNFYNYFVGTPDYFEKDLDRYRKVTAADVQQAARHYLVDAHRVVLSVVPQGKPELAVQRAVNP